jgi:hypothetical protein
MKDITYYTIIGGSKQFREAATLGVDSIIRQNPNAKIKIFDFDNLFEHEHAETVDCRGELDKSKKDIGYLYWRQKYVKALELETEYGVYWDCDTVMINDYSDDIFEGLNGKIGSAQHWWTPSFHHFYNLALEPHARETYIKTLKDIGANMVDSYYAGGVFVFKNDEKTRTLFENVVSEYDKFNKVSDGVIKTMTDEYFFSAVCRDHIIDLGGSLNVCPKGNGISTDLIIEDGELLGKNCYDDEYQPVIFIHCNLHKGDPLDNNYSNEIKQIIKESYKL